MRYLAIDHGTKHCGWALLDDGELCGFGALELCEPYPQSLKELIGEAMELISVYDAEAVVLEKPMQLRNGAVAQQLIEHYAVCKLAALSYGVDIIEVSPPTMKLHVAGHGKADKDDVARAVAKRFGLRLDEVAVPLYYKDKKRAGQVRERLYDSADAIGLAVAAWEMDREAVKA